MPTIQELLASGDLYNANGAVNAATDRNSIASLLNQGAGYMGRAGLDIPGYTFKNLVNLPQLYTSTLVPDGGTDANYNPTYTYVNSPISYKDAIASNFAGVSAPFQDSYRGVSNIGDVFDVAGLQSPELRNWISGRITDGAPGNEYGAYIPDSAYNSLLNDLSGYNASDNSEFNKNSLLASAAVIGGGLAYNAYGAVGAEVGGAPVVDGGMTTAEINSGIAANGGAPVASGGYAYGSSTLPATTYGIGESAAPSVGTPLPATGAGSGSTVGMSASEELAAAGYTPEQIAAFQETGFLPAAAGTSGGVGGAISAAGNVSSAGSALSRILGGNASTSDWLNVLGTAGATGLGVYSDIQKTNALNDLADKYAGYGAPYRQRLSDLYANPSSFLSSPEVQVPVQQGTDAMARSLSAKVGNPVFSGTALQELQNYSSNQLFSKLGQEKDRLAGFGGLTAYNSAAPGAAANAINSSGNALTTLAGGVSDIFNPRQTLSDLFKQYQGNNLFGVA